MGEQVGAEIHNLSQDFADGQILLKLMAKLAKDNLVTLAGFDLDAELEKPAEERIERALQIAEQMGTERFLRVQDIASANPKLIFTLLAETFSNAISNEVGVGRDAAAERAPLALGGLILEVPDLKMLRDFSFRPCCQFDEMRAGGLLDPIELSICAEERCKSVIRRDSLKQVTEQHLDDNIYQLLMPDVPEAALQTLLSGALENVRDVVDELQARDLGPAQLADLTALFRFLMALSADEVERARVLRTDFCFLGEKLAKRGLPTSCALPFLFYLHAMSLTSGNAKYDDLARKFVHNFVLQLQELPDLEQRCAFHYICVQLGVLGSAELKQTSVSLATQALRESDPVLARTCASMAFVTLASAPIDFPQAEAVLRECGAALEKMGPPRRRRTSARCSSWSARSWCGRSRSASRPRWRASCWTAARRVPASTRSWRPRT